MITKNIAFKKNIIKVVGSGILTLAFVFAGVPAIASAQTFTQTLKLGSRGTEVSSLQTYLSEDPAIYPSGLVTGYFGTLTNAGVKRFQTRNNLASDGIVGPMTRSVLNGSVVIGGGYTGGDEQAPQILSANMSRGANMAVFNWTTGEAARSTVYYSTSPLNPVENGNNVIINGTAASTDSNYKNSNSISLTNLQPNTVYYYMLYSVDQVGNVTITWPATFQTTN